MKEMYTVFLHRNPHKAEIGIYFPQLVESGMVTHSVTETNKRAWRNNTSIGLPKKCLITSKFHLDLYSLNGSNNKCL